MEKHLISYRYYKDALERARQMKLKLNEWTWVPFNETYRQRKLLGRRVSDIKYLIGDFTDKEKEYLIYPRSNKNAF